MSSNLNLEISNLALNINQTTKEEIAEMITEECEDKYSLKDHTHDSFDTLTINKDIMIPNEEENSGYTLLKSGAFYSYDKDRQIDCTLDGIHIHNFTDNNTMYIGPGSISVNGQSVSFEGHTHDYAASNHTHTMADITDLELPEIDTSNLATKEELAGKADANHTHSTYDAAYQRVNELKEVYSWNTGYNGTGTQTTANIIANGGLTVNNKAVSMEGHTHDYAPSNHTHNNYAASNHTHNNYAASNHTHNTFDNNITVDGKITTTEGFEVENEAEPKGTSLTNDGFHSYEGAEKEYISNLSAERLQIWNFENNTHTSIDYSSIEVVGSNSIIEIYGDGDSSGIQVNGDPVLTKSQLINLFYPVGSIYTSMNSTSPASLFGGKWTQITDRFLYCANSSKATGGNKKIKVENLPAHTHAFSGNTQTGTIPQVIRPQTAAVPSGIVKTEYQQIGRYSDDSNSAFLTNFRLEIPCTGSIGPTGSGTDYMPPYMTVYAWYRTA